MKKVSKSPAFQFYPQDFISSLDVQMMSAEQVGCYILLLSYSWIGEEQPYLNDDEKTLAFIARVSVEKWREISPLVLKKFKQKDGKIYNERLLKELEKQKNFSKDMSKAGSKGNDIRWGKGKGKVSPTRSPSDSQGIANDRSSSSFSSSISTSDIQAHALPQIKQEFLNLAELQIKGVAFSNPAFQKKWEVGSGEFSKPLVGLCQKWATDIEKLHRIDKASFDDIEQVIRWLYSGKTEDSLFWRKNIMSGDKLRKQYQKLVGSALSEIQTKRGGLNLDEV